MKFPRGEEGTRKGVKGDFKNSKKGNETTLTLWMSWGEEKRQDKNRVGGGIVEKRAAGKKGVESAANLGSTKQGRGKARGSKKFPGNRSGEKTVPRSKAAKTEERCKVRRESL